MGLQINEAGRWLRRIAARPAGEVAVELPRHLAQLALVLVPLWYTYRDQRGVFWILLVCVVVVGLYRVLGENPEAIRLNKRRVYARSTAKVLEDIRDLVLDSSNHELGETQSAILRIIVDRTRDMVGGAAAGSISANLMAHHPDDRLEIVAVDQPTKDRHGKSRITLRSQGAGEALRTGKAVYIDDVKKLGGAFRPDAPYRSILSIPIRSDDRLIGVVSVDSTEPGHFYRGIHDHLDPYVQLLGLYMCLRTRLRAET